MTIYATPYDNATKRPTGPATDSGFPDLDSVVASCGTGHVLRNENSVIYDYGGARVIFSPVQFHIDDKDSSA